MIMAVIPARGGSRGIPGKNVRSFLGKPLLAWTIEVARESGVFARVLVSTDNEEIAEAGKRYGADVPFRRPPELARDETPTALVIRHAMEWCRSHNQELPEVVMVLEPTSPCRRPFHLIETAALFKQRAVESVASVSEVPHHYVHEKLLRLHPDGTMTGMDGTPIRDMRHRRQELPTYYAFNGLVFACRSALIMRDPTTLWGERVTAYCIDRKYNLDLDVPEDWAVAESCFRRLLQEEGLLGHGAGRLRKRSAITLPLYGRSEGRKQ